MQYRINNELKRHNRIVTKLSQLPQPVRKVSLTSDSVTSTINSLVPLQSEQEKEDESITEIGTLNDEELE